MVADDDRALQQRLAALEAEVKADADAQRARVEAAKTRIRAERAEREAAKPKPQPPKETDHSDLGGALELAKKPGKGQKSWKRSGIASLALGPAGWLYAGSLREAIPATAMWLTLATLVYKILPFLMLPVFLVVLPLSAIAGVIYALQYNRHGERQRLFDGAGKKPKQLPGR